MILVVIIFIIAILIISCAAFVTLPHVVDDLVDAYDEWRHVFERIKRRTKQ